MFTVLEYYEMPSPKETFETTEQAREYAIHALRISPASIEKKYIVEILEVLVNDVPIPPVKSVNIKTILDFKDKSKILEELTDD